MAGGNPDLHLVDEVFSAETHGGRERAKANDLASQFFSQPNGLENPPLGKFLVLVHLFGRKWTDDNVTHQVSAGIGGMETRNTGPDNGPQIPDNEFPHDGRETF
jgi:hypothetical protein